MGMRSLCNCKEQAKGRRSWQARVVTPDVIRKFRAQTDITAFHLSAKKIIDSGMRYRKEGVPMGIPAMSEYSIFRTDREIVAQAREALA